MDNGLKKGHLSYDFDLRSPFFFYSFSLKTQTARCVHFSPTSCLEMTWPCF